MKLLVIFVALTITNVVLSTIKSIVTVNGGKWSAAAMNALTYGVYTVVIIYTMCDLPTVLKAFVTAGCNFLGVFIVKLIEEKKRKDRLWKVEFTVKGEDVAMSVDHLLTKREVPHNYLTAGSHYIFNCYCATKTDTDKVSDIIKHYNGKYFASESKVVL